MKRIAVWCHSKLINSKPSSSLQLRVVISRCCYSRCYCFCCWCRCLRLFALKIAQLLMQHKPNKTVLQSASICWAECTNEMANQHKRYHCIYRCEWIEKDYDMAERKAEKTLHKLAYIVPMFQLSYYSISCDDVFFLSTFRFQASLELSPFTVCANKKRKDNTIK